MRPFIQTVGSISLSRESRGEKGILAAFPAPERLARRAAISLQQKDHVACFSHSKFTILMYLSDVERWIRTLRRSDGSLWSNTTCCSTTTRPDPASPCFTAWVICHNFSERPKVSKCQTVKIFNFSDSLIVHCSRLKASRCRASRASWKNLR